MDPDARLKFVCTQTSDLSELSCLLIPASLFLPNPCDMLHLTGLLLISPQRPYNVKEIGAIRSRRAY